MNDDMTEYFAGRKLYGDDFDLARISAWYADEKEGYADLREAATRPHRYIYHYINRRFGFDRLPSGLRFDSVLAFGAAEGEEVAPLAPKIKRFVVVEPSDRFPTSQIGGVPATYVKPAIDGVLPFPDASFDLITCFGVLHHIPNVSTVMREFARCLKPGGYALVREPTVSMGDWRQPRRGLTKRERGIPLGLFRKMIAAAGLVVVAERRFWFPVTQRIAGAFGGSAMESPGWLMLDRAFCRAFAWNRSYHGGRTIDKLRPTNVFYVLRKPAAT